MPFSSKPGQGWAKEEESTKLPNIIIRSLFIHYNGNNTNVDGKQLDTITNKINEQSEISFTLPKIDVDKISINLIAVYLLDSVNKH